MIISQYKHKNAVNKIIEALPEACKKDPEVSKFLNELSLSVNPHYCVGYMNYIEDGMYSFTQDPMEFKTKEEALKYIEEEFDIDCGYYDDEKQVWTDAKGDHPEKYKSEDEGVRIWFEKSDLINK